MRISWDFGILPWKRKFPVYKRGLVLQWHITERCGQRCAHCYQDGQGSGELSHDGLLDIVEQYKTLLKRKYGNSDGAIRGHVTITGGDPFVRDDFWPLMEALAWNRELFSFAILTNGLRIGADEARRLKKLGPRFIQLSVEGERETHDAIRGKGDYDRVAKVLSLLARHKVATMISFTAHAENYRQFPAVARLGMQLGVDKVWTDRLIPCGQGAGLEPMNTPQTNEYLSIIKEERRKAGKAFFNTTQIAADRALQFITAGGRPYRCSAGDGLITIMPDGSLYPCRRMPVAVGNVTKAPLANLYHGSALFKDLRDKAKVSQGCEGCLYQRFCGGGLKCLSHAVMGDPFKADPGCPMANSKAQKEMNFVL